MSDEPGPGHNSIAVDQLDSFVKRIVALEEEKKALADDIKDVLNEAAGTGFDKKALRAAVSFQMLDSEKRQEKLDRDAIIDLYMEKLGLI